MNHNYYVYILECADHKYYVGITNNLERRFAEHVNGFNKKCFTFKRRPVKLVYHQHFFSVYDAITFEKQVKGWRREKKQALINGELSFLPELSKSYAKKHEN